MKRQGIEGTNVVIQAVEINLRKIMKYVLIYKVVHLNL